MEEGNFDLSIITLNSSVNALVEVCSADKPEYADELGDFWREIAGQFAKRRNDVTGGEVHSRNKYGESTSYGSVGQSNVAMFDDFLEVVDDMTYAQRSLKVRKNGSSSHVRVSQSEIDEMPDGHKRDVRNKKIDYLDENMKPTGTIVEVSNGNELTVSRNSNVIFKVCMENEHLKVVIPLSTNNGNRVILDFNNPRVFGILEQGLFWSDYFPVV